MTPRSGDLACNAVGRVPSRSGIYGAMYKSSPASGVGVLSSTRVHVTASDDAGVSRVDLAVDGKFYARSSSATPVFSWNTNKLSGGPHTLQAVAYDAAGNSTRSKVVTVYKLAAAKF